MRNMGTADQGLIRRVLAGEKEAYGLLVSARPQAVFRVAFRITENEADVAICSSRPRLYPAWRVTRSARAGLF